MVGVPCSRLLRQVQTYIVRQEMELDALRAQLDARGEGITEADLPDDLRKRLMPEGMEWPRFEDGEPVWLGDLANCWCSTPIEVDGFELTVCNDGEFRWSVEGMRDDHGISRRECIRLGLGERVKRPEPPATASQGCRDTVAPDSWERLGHDIECYGIGYASMLPDESCRERDALVARAKALCAGPDVVRPGEVV